MPQRLCPAELPPRCQWRPVHHHGSHGAPRCACGAAFRSLLPPLQVPQRLCPAGLSPRCRWRWAGGLLRLPCLGFLCTGLVSIGSTLTFVLLRRPRRWEAVLAGHRLLRSALTRALVGVSVQQVFGSCLHEFHAVCGERCLGWMTVIVLSPESCGMLWTWTPAFRQKRHQ